MRQDFFEFWPQFKLLIVGNHKPPLHSVDDAVRRRFNIVPFENNPPRPDPDLQEKLKDEWPAILRWMIEGALDWQERGLVRPAVVQSATEVYFSDQDVLGQWLDEECEVELGNTYLSETVGALFASWKMYAERLGEPAHTAKTFNERMRQKGFDYHRGSQGIRLFRGVRLKPKLRSVTGDGW
jgi:putative DNA primase/helicase